jgi:ApbE superfamily uncharacterized protein (UPF0280 family)
VVQRLAGGRLHLQHGPIDVVLRAWGAPPDVATAEAAAARRFATILDELVSELPSLRADVRPAPALHGAVARRMWAGCAPFAARGIFVTAMAAVAGAVADELLAAMRAAAPGLARAYVNDGGDIAVFVAPGQRVEIGLVADPDGAGAPFDASLALTHELGVGGVATSGRHGRSFSLGIADAVTVLARDAATADAAATLIANAVTLDSPAVARRPAREPRPRQRPRRPAGHRRRRPARRRRDRAALEAGAARARAWIEAGLIRAAALRLRGERRVAGHPFPALTDRAA